MNPIIIGALCGIVVNEVEGFVAENMTEQEIIDTIEQDICSQAPSFEAFCDSLISKIPQIVSKNTHWTPPSMLLVCLISRVLFDLFYYCIIFYRLRSITWRTIKQ